MSYKNQEIWQLAREQSNKIHAMSLKLPKFEMYETGSQIRRSAKSVRSNIVEGYGRRRYKQEYIRFLVFALASNDETHDHLDSLFEIFLSSFCHMEALPLPTMPDHCFVCR